MTKWLVSTQTGSDANGGTSQTVVATGTDGVSNATSGLTLFSSISATWTSALIGQAIRASSGTITRLISAVQAQQTATATSNSTATLTSSAAFTSGMVGCAVSGPGISAGTIVTAFGSSSSITISPTAGAGSGSGTFTFGAKLTTTGTTAFTAATGQTWNVGGMKATLNQCMVTASGLRNVIAAGDQIYVGAGTYRETVADAISGSQLATTYNGTNGSSLTTLGSVITLASVSGLVAPPLGYYNQGSVVTSAGVVGFTWTGISGSTLTGVVFAVNNTVTAAATVASAAVLVVSTPVWIIGDVDGAQTGQAGQVTQSAYTSTDTAVPSTTVTLSLTTSTNLSWALISFISGTAQSLVTCSAGSLAAHYTFVDCAFNALQNGGFVIISLNASSTGLALGLITDRCLFFGGSGAVAISAPTTVSGSGDFDLLCVVRNSMCLSFGTGVNLSATGTSANHPGGLRVYDCTIVSSSVGVHTATASELSTTIPCEVHGCVVYASSDGVAAATAGQLVGSYNVIYSPTPEVNYTYGTGDVSNSAGGTATYAAPLFELGQSYKWAGVLRQFLAPDTTSPLRGIGAPTFTGNYPIVDWANRPRPSGGNSASATVGYAEVHDFSVQDTVTFPSGQTSSAKMSGPGDTDIWVPVDAISTTLAIQLNQGSGYGGTSYATATLEANGELGITAQVQTCSSTLSAWQTLTFSAITASKAGWVKVRISSFDTSGTGTLNFGALTAT